MQDPHGHLISYLRLSVTDRCNERCQYCLPEELQAWTPRQDLLTWDELIRVTRVASQLGIHKFRITGGEPLTRKGLVSFIRAIRVMPSITSLGISTNGSLLNTPDPEDPNKPLASSLVEAGVDVFNVSLDTLNPQRYQQITKRNYLDQVLSGLSCLKSSILNQSSQKTQHEILKRIRLNCVLSQSTTSNEIRELISFAKHENFLLRFIELMPVSTTDVLHRHQFMSTHECKQIIAKEFGELTPRHELKSNGPSQYYQVQSTGQILGFIGAMTNLHFCETCNKLRLTADGKLRPCLGNHLEFDLRESLRNPLCRDEDLKTIFKQTVARKPLSHEFSQYVPQRRMIAIGG